MPKPTHRWYSFTLRKQLLSIAVFCTPLAPFAAAFMRLHAARQLQESGMSVQWEDGNGVEARDFKQSLMRFPMCVETEEATIPVEHLARIRPVSEAYFYGIECTVDDDDLALIGGFRELRKLTIDSSNISTNGIRSISELPHIEHLLLRSNEAQLDGVGPVLSGMKSLRLLAVNSRNFTDNDLRHIRNLKNLEELDISGTSITDAGMTELRSLRNLRRLHCHFTRLTDGCIPAIARLENLEELYIDLTGVSEEGKVKLLRLMPSLRLHPA